MHELDSQSNQIWSDKDSNGVRWLVPLESQSGFSPGLFNMESQLEQFLILNWVNTELGKKFDLIYKGEALISQQYRTDIGRIDILAKDKFTGSYVVIELKKGQSSDDTVGQIMRYMGWIEEKFGDKNVKGIIVSGIFDEKLHYALKPFPRVEVYLYEISFRLRNHSR